MSAWLFNRIYNIADSMIAGRFAGEDALAAVGASYPITVIFMAFAVGMNLGASVIVSRLFGAGDRKGVKRAVTTAFASSLSLAVILTVYGYFFSRNMMEWIHTPQNIMQDGVLYLKIYVFGLIFLMLYNVCTGIFTALGDSRTPLWFLLGSSAGNIALDLLFVAKLHWGVAGVAWATFIAQGISAVLALVTLLVRLQKFAGTERVPLFDRKLFVQILAIAVPSILQQSVLSVGNLFVQDIVNRYGSAVVAGYSGAIKLNTFAINIFMTLGSCLSSYTAQNIGSRKTGEDFDGISDRAETFGADSASVCSPLFRTQPADDGAFPECRKFSGDPCRCDVSSDCLAVVFHDRGETYDRWNHPWFRGNDLLCHRDDSGPDSSNRICTDAFAQIWKYGNLDGVAVRVDRSNCIDDYFLSESKK